jgi:hypothetical protein
VPVATWGWGVDRKANLHALLPKGVPWVAAKSTSFQRAQEGSTMSDFKPGVYEHYKGGLYRALFLVEHHETRQPMVVYVSLLHGTVNVRPLHQNAVQHDPDGWNALMDVAGSCPPAYTPRFKFLHP